MEDQLGKPPILPIPAKLYFTNSFVCATTYKDGATPYLSETIGRRLQPSGFNSHY